MAGTVGVDLIFAAYNACFNTDTPLYFGTNNLVSLSYLSARNSISFSETPEVATNIMWHAGNDAHNSGLDADLLDSQHGSYYSAVGHTHDDRYYTETELDAGQLDTRYYTETEIDTALALYLPLAGGTMTGDLIFNPASNIFNIMSATADAGDDQMIYIAGGGAASQTRGAYMSLSGNEKTGQIPGQIILRAGAIAGNLGGAGTITLQTDHGDAFIAEQATTPRMPLGVLIDTIGEYTGAAGITIDSVQCKDGSVYVVTTGEVGMSGKGRFIFTDASPDTILISGATLITDLVSLNDHMTVAATKDILFASDSSSEIGSSTAAALAVHADTYYMGQQTDVYTTSGAAGYHDDHWPNDDTGKRFYSGANLMMTISRLSAASPTVTMVDYPVILDFYRAGVVKFRLSNTFIATYPKVTLYGGAKTNGVQQYQCRDTATYIASLTVNRLDIVGPNIDMTGIVNIGDGGTTNYVSIDATGDVNFVGGAGLAFGEVWVIGNAVATDPGTAGTFVQFLGFDTDGSANDTTPDHTNDHITVDKTGKYLVVCSIHAESVGGGLADIISVSIRTNNGTVTHANLHNHGKLIAGGGGDITPITVSGIGVFTAADTVEVWATNDSNDTEFVFVDANLTLVQIGG